MSDLSVFESRHGKAKCTAADLFTFVSDLRNFEQFIPRNAVKNWEADPDSCSFKVPVPGTVNVRIIEKIKFTRVVYNGDALKKNDFTLTLNISETGESVTDVQISLSADLNPVMKMMVIKPIDQFLEMLISEMESFTGWKNIR